MSNFAFLKTEFAPLYQHARSMENLVLRDPRSSCFRARLALELVVHWLYDHERSLRKPYDTNLGALLHEGTFKSLLPPPLFTKMRAIQKAGNQDHITIRKVRLNQSLTEGDLQELDRFLFESGEAEDRETLEEAFGKQESLALFIRSLVGLDRNAAKEAFAKYLDENRFTGTQIRFIEHIIDHLTKKGMMDPGLLYEQPFTGLHYEGLDGVFPGAVADEIVTILEMMKKNAAA